MELVEILSLQEQETLIEITRKWVAIKRREEIAMSIAEAHEAYKAGKVKPMSIFIRHREYLLAFCQLWQ